MSFAIQALRVNTLALLQPPSENPQPSVEPASPEVNRPISPIKLSRRSGPISRGFRKVSAPIRERANHTANMLTIGNGLSGFASLVYASRGDFRSAAIAVLMGMVFDAADGPVARKLGPTKQGAQLDSLADGTTFGAAAAFLGYTFATSGLAATAFESRFAAVAAGAHLSAALWRLADFNTSKFDGKFRGEPSPAAAGLVVAMTLADPTTALGFSPSAKAMVMGMTMFATAYFMVSGIPYAKRGLLTPKVLTAAIPSLFVTMFFSRNAVSGLANAGLAGILAYTGSGPVGLWLNSRKNRSVAIAPEQVAAIQNAETQKPATIHSPASTLGQTTATPISVGQTAIAGAAQTMSGEASTTPAPIIVPTNGTTPAALPKASLPSLPPNR